MKAQQKQNGEESPQTIEAFENSNVESLEAIAMLLLREVEFLEKQQFPNVNDVLSRKIRLHEEVEKFEISLICQALIKAKGKQTEAAKLLEIKLTTLNVKIKKYKIDIDALLAESEQ